MKLTLNQSAKEAGKAKKTLLDALKNGRLSGVKNKKGQWEIETSELFRVFPKPVYYQPQEPLPTPKDKQENHSETSVLQTKVDLLLERVEELKAERDKWQEQASRITTLIEDQSGKKKGFFERLFK